METLAMLNIFSMFIKRFFLFGLTLCVIALAGCGSPSPSGKGSAAVPGAGHVGIVLLHGSWDKQPTLVEKLAGKLEDAGYKVVTPMMPWSAMRQYDVSYPQALLEVDAAVKGLRERYQVTRIVVAGHSIGASTAFVYAARNRQSVDAIAALGPARSKNGTGPYLAVHNPGGLSTRSKENLAKAKAMMDAGAGSQLAWFNDGVQTQTRMVHAPAQAYHSYIDPEGLSDVQKAAASIAPPIPVFMAVGKTDLIAPAAKEGIFDRAPKHAKSVYLSVPGGHNETPDAASSAFIAWLGSLGF
jgi:pimeloyl-ACP methyl ester carboxylesterase